MSCVSEGDFLNFISEIRYPGLNKKWTWLIEHKPTEEFIEWLCENVDSSNYLSDEELNEYRRLEESGLVLEDEDLDTALNEDIPEYFELQDIDDDYIAALKDELNYLENYTSTLNDFLYKQQHEVIASQREVAELENKTANMRKKLVNAQSECLAKSSSFESSLQQLSSHLVDLKKYCLNNGQDISHRFLSEIPLVDYIEESASFSRELDLKIEEVMSSANLKGNSDFLSKEAFTGKLENAKQGLRETLLFRVEEAAWQKGLTSACEHVKSVLQNRRLWEFSSNPCIVVEKLAEQKQNLRRMEARAKQCGQVEIRVQGSVVEPKLREYIAKYVNKQCSSLEKLHRDLQFHQKQAICDKLRKLEGELKNQSAMDLVWLFLLGEEVTEVLNLFELAKSGEAFLMREQQDRIVRIESMKYLKDARNCGISKSETWCLINVLTSYLKTYHDMLSKSTHSLPPWMSTPEDILCSLKSITDFIEKYEGDNEEIDSMMKERSNTTVSSLMSRCKELKELKSLICCGSTRDYPVIWSVNQLMFCFGSDAISKKLKKRCGKILAAYQGERQLSVVEEDIGRNLWKQFLCNPEEVKALINSMDSH